MRRARIRLSSHTNTAFLRVKRVRIFGLFGLYDHDVPLHMEDRVTILHGPNGVGKTVLLRLVAAVFQSDFEELVKVPFKKLVIELSDHSILSLEQQKLFFDDYPASYFRVGLLAFLLGVNGERLQKATIETNRREVFTGAVPPAKAYAPWPTTEDDKVCYSPYWIAELRIHVHLIETQRLLRTNSPDEGGGLVPTVRDCALDLHARITEALASYATEAQSLDQSFPQRLLKTRGQNGFALSDLKARMTALNDKRAHLQKIGLLDSATSSAFEVESLDDIDPAQSNVMMLYVEDTERKLAVLDDVARRITLLLDNVNGKFRNKSIQMSRKRGFVVLGHDNARLKSDSLSSGEQHELVQLYDLLFRVEPGTLVLIDEPELSLHVLWQKKYLADLLEIAKTVGFDAIVATHSPFIAGDRSDLMVALAADIDS